MRKMIAIVHTDTRCLIPWPDLVNKVISVTRLIFTFLICLLDIDFCLVINKYISLSNLLAQIRRL